LRLISRWMFFAQVPVARPALSLVPLPAEVFQDPGVFTLDKDSRIAAGRELAPIGEKLARFLRPATGFSLPVGRGGRHSIYLHLDAKLTGLSPEGYRLQVTPERVDLYAGNPAGLFYGFQTIRELLPTDIFRAAAVPQEAWTMPAVRIVDRPRFAWRGAHIDVSRHFEQKSFVEKFLDEMALHKLNVFHWHLVDDNGWRMEIKKYPLLTSVGSTMDFTSMNPREGTRSRSELPGGFYTQADIKEVVAFFLKLKFPGTLPPPSRHTPNWATSPRSFKAGAT
jgi:hexosaminidase